MRKVSRYVMTRVFGRGFFSLGLYVLRQGITAHDCVDFRRLVAEVLLIVLMPFAKKPDKFRFRLVGIEKNCTIVILSWSF
jgi:hypothetical protein